MISRRSRFAAHLTGGIQSLIVYGVWCDVWYGVRSRLHLDVQQVVRLALQIVVEKRQWSQRGR